MLLQIKFGHGRKATSQSPLGLTNYSRKPEQPVAELEPILEARPTPAAKPAPVHPRVKTYFADSVRQAMQMASRDLGDDAVLIQSEPSGEHPDGRFRVTCGSMTQDPFDAMFQDRLSATRTSLADEPTPAESGASNIATSETERGLRMELDSLREDFAALRGFVFRNQLGTNHPEPSSHSMAPLQTALIGQGIEAEVAAQWLLDAHSSLEAESGQSPAECLVGHLAKSIEMDDAVDRPMVLVGPAGSGKTTALLKLALTQGVRRGKKVQILTVGNDIDGKVNSIANLLEIPVKNFPVADALRTALDQPSSPDMLTLVDTTGLPALPGSGRDDALATALRGLPVAVHLTLPATWGRVNLQRAMDRFEMFSPSHLLFTMMDQTETPGLALEQAWRTGKKLSFTNWGPMGTGSIGSASVSALLSACFGGGTAEKELSAGSAR